MTADLFLTTFLACLLALTFVAVFGYQITRWLIKRGVTKAMPKIMGEAIHKAAGTHHGGSAEDRDALAELLRAAHNTPPGVVPHVSRVVCGCGQAIDVPAHMNLPEHLEANQWGFVDPHRGWACPPCALGRLPLH